MPPLHLRAHVGTVFEQPHAEEQQIVEIRGIAREVGSRTKVAVISAGVKSILDIGKTLEYLETLGVPVVAHFAPTFVADFEARVALVAPRAVLHLTATSCDPSSSSPC